MHESPNSADNKLGKGPVLGDFQSQWANDKGAADSSVRKALETGDIETIMSALVPSRLFIALIAEIAGEPSEVTRIQT